MSNSNIKKDLVIKLPQHGDENIVDAVCKAFDKNLPNAHTHISLKPSEKQEQKAFKNIETFMTEQAWREQLGIMLG